MISLPLFLSKCQCMVECKNEGTQTCQVSLSVAFFHYTATKYRSRGSLVYYVVGRVIKWTHKMMMLNYCSIYKAKSHFLPSLSQFFLLPKLWLQIPYYTHLWNVILLSRKCVPALYHIRKLMPTLNRGTDFTNTKESVITWDQSLHSNYEVGLKKLVKQP